MGRSSGSRPARPTWSRSPSTRTTGSVTARSGIPPATWSASRACAESGRGRPSEPSGPSIRHANSAAVQPPNYEETTMSSPIRSLVIPVSDLAAAKAVYTALLGQPHTDQPYYVGYNVDGFEVAQNPSGSGGGAVAYADVDDLDGIRETLLAAG